LNNKKDVQNHERIMSSYRSVMVVMSDMNEAQLVGGHHPPRSPFSAPNAHQSLTDRSGQSLLCCEPGCRLDMKRWSSAPFERLPDEQRYGFPTGPGLSRHHTPRFSPHMSLCSCGSTRTHSRSSNTHVARSRSSVPPTGVMMMGQLTSFSLSTFFA
jgi:hypothetical protein